MTDLERYEPRTAPVLPAQPTELTRWVNEFREVATISSQLARTHFVPTSLHVWRKRDGQEWFDAEATTAQVASVIMTGQEIGLGPMAALRSVDVIQGTPALRAIALRALLLAHGHEVWIEEATNHRCTIAGRRAGSDNVQRLTWTMDDARSRNLAGKPNWRTQPRNMLMARATADIARLIAADAIMGVPYVAEELEDGAGEISANGAAVDQAPPTRRTRRPRPVTAGPPADEPALDEPAQTAAEPTDTPAPPPAPTEPQDEPPLDQPATDEPEQDAEPPPLITPPQMRLLHKLIRDRDLDRDQALTAMSELCERPIESSKDLTSDEASRVIDWLTPDPPDDEP